MKSMMAIQLLLFVFLLIPRTVTAQASASSRQKFAAIGNLALENGHQLMDCRIGYRTFGKLNARRSNTVLYPTGGGGTSEMHELSAGLDVDTTRFYLVVVDALGNGVSSSPSNSSSQPRTRFPEFTIRDMVNSQYKMLTDHLDIHHLAAIVGGSMGGFQALQWSVSYPGFMDKVVVIDATPKLSSFDLLWMKTYVAAVVSDTGYRGGNYTTRPVLMVASNILQLVSTSPASFNKMVPVDSFYAWITSVEKAPITYDINDWLWQIKACMTQDISFNSGGLMESAAKKIKAKMLVIANKQDLLVNQTLAVHFAKMVNAQLMVMDNEMGHLIFDDKVAVGATRKFLND